jgi:uncharacterized membrane protein
MNFMVNIRVILLTALSAFIGSIGQIEFKRGAESLSFTLRGIMTNYHFLAGIAIYVLSTFLYVYSLSKDRLSVLYPIIATSYIWTTILAKIFLNEPVKLSNWLGVSLILLGVVFTSL